MKKIIGTVGLLAAGAIGITSFVYGQETTDSTLEVSCGSAELSVGVTALNFESLSTNLTTQMSNGTWAGGGAGGITVTDTLAGCPAQEAWNVKLSFSDLVGSGTNNTLSIAATNDTVTDANGDGNVQLYFSPGSLTVVQGAQGTTSPVTVASPTYDSSADNPNVLTRADNYETNGIFRLTPTVSLGTPGGLAADTYKGTVEVQF